CLDGNCVAGQGTGIAFGTGVGFTNASSGADRQYENHDLATDQSPPPNPPPNPQFEQIGRTARITGSVTTFDSRGTQLVKQVRRDWIDLDGNGVPERMQLVPFSDCDHSGNTGTGYWH